jgi:hypothetical protein
MCAAGGGGLCQKEGGDLPETSALTSVPLQDHIHALVLGLSEPTTWLPSQLLSTSCPLESCCRPHRRDRTVCVGVPQAGEVGEQGQVLPQVAVTALCSVPGGLQVREDGQHMCNFPAFPVTITTQLLSLDLESQSCPCCEMHSCPLTCPCWEVAHLLA